MPDIASVLIRQRVRLREVADVLTRSGTGCCKPLSEDLRDLRAQLRDGNLTIDFQLHDADEKVDHLVDGLLASAAVLAASRAVTTSSSRRSR